ncbi:Spermine synthase [Halotydeus destructor]|nr:Spermine synthase [Halotydeus destructor]
MASFKGAVCHFSFKTSPLTSVTVDDAIAQVKECLKDLMLLSEVATVPLNDGKMVILTTEASSENPSLTATIRIYNTESFITVTIQGAGSLNTPVFEHSYTFAIGTDSKGINNNSTEKVRSDIKKALGVDIDYTPVIRLGSDVQLYFTTSDERLIEYDFDKLVYDGMSKYQNVRIYRSPTMGNALILDDLQNLAERDIAYTQGLMNYGNVDYKDKEILILGGGDGGLLNELLKEEPKFVTMVDIDEMVVEACRQHLRGACGSVLDTLKTDKYHVIIDDCLKYLDDYISSGRQFDVVFNDLTDIPLSSENSEVGTDLWSFVKNILNKSLQCLKSDGKYLNHAIGTGCTGALAAYENVLNNLPVKVSYKRHTAFVPSFYEE